MKKFFVLNALTLFVFTLLSVTARSQGTPAARPSPPDSVSGKIGNANIEIKYSSPSVKGRKIWGGLESYGKVWRAGANEATTFSTDKDIMVEGKKLPAGKYAFFLIPTETDWTAVFNKTAAQWGAFKYDEKQDALRVTVKPRKKDAVQERLNYAINKGGIVLNWEHMEVPVAIK